jgi:hypothetical protein
LKKKIHHFAVPYLHEVDAWDLGKLLSSLRETRGCASVTKALHESGRPVLRVEMRAPVRGDLIEHVLAAYVYGGDVPTKGMRLVVKDAGISIRGYSTAVTPRPIELRKGERLEVADVMPAGDIILVVKTGAHAHQYAVVAPSEWVKLFDDGELELYRPGDAKDTEQKGGEGSGEKAQDKAATSIFAKSGSYGRVNSDFPDFERTSTMRAYLSLTKGK